MREILFKAKRKDNGKWVEGYYCKLDETTYCIKEDYERNPVPTHHYILRETMTDWGLPNRFLQFEIDPETLCQYTGLADKNGNKIWENDIVRNKAKWGDWLGRVVFKNSCFVVEWCKYEEHSKKGINAFTENLTNAKEVIGNIFDNADLLEVE